MAVYVYVLFVNLLLAAALVYSQQPAFLRLPAAEQEAAYLALESINPSVSWRALYPDDLCLSGPHGLVCDLFPSSYASDADLASHVVELNFGFVSDYSSNPPCGPDAVVPTSLSSFPFLRKLFFYNCFTNNKISLSGVFWNLSSTVEEIAFHQNPTLGGHLSGRIVGLPRLRRLIVSGSRVSGSIPPEVGNLCHLEQLVLSRNRLRGVIPQIIGQLGQLRVLDLSGNRLSGALPSEIGQLESLLKLDLGSNQISGRVPAELGQLRRLELLDLSENRLTGGVPAEMAEMVSLREVHLSGNPLGGAIPDIWQNLRSLLGIGMSRLGLVGRIPASMGVHLPRLSYLMIDNNELEGEVPEQFRCWEGTALEINLENNGLGGRVPFSAAFAARLGGKLKLSGNLGLCLGDELVGGDVGLGYLRRCNMTAVPHPVLFTSASSPSENGSLFSSFVFVIFCSLFTLKSSIYNS